SGSEHRADEVTQPTETRAPEQATGRPSLADTFSAILAAERGEAPAPALASPPELSDALVDAVAERVARRLTDAVLREVVSKHRHADAERLLADESETLKAGLAYAHAGRSASRPPCGLPAAHLRSSVMTVVPALPRPVSVPEKPALEGLEAKWQPQWEADGV